MTRTETVPTSALPIRLAAWEAQGWVFARFFIFVREGQRMARVTLVREEDQGD